MDTLGFDWNIQERKSFEHRIAEIRAYKEKHGNVYVKWNEDRSLYGFCTNMRQARKHPEKSTMALTDDRIASLDALGFNWSIKEHAAKKSFAQSELRSMGV